MAKARGNYFAQFFRRKTSDGTYDSICGLCFITVGVANTAEDLRTQEAVHSCFAHAFK